MKRTRRAPSLEKQYQEVQKEINSLLKSKHRSLTCKAEDDAYKRKHREAMSAAIRLGDQLLKMLDNICIDKLNSFPANYPCTIRHIAHKIDVPWYRLKRVMINTIPADTPGLHDIIYILNVLASGHVGRKVLVCDDYEIPVIILPNWRFVTSANTDLLEYVERIEL